MSNNITEGLVACYAFNNNANDLSGNGNNGSYNIEFVRDRNSSQASAGLFSNGKYVEIPGGQFNFQNDMSLSFWIKPYNSQVQYANIFDKSHARTGSGWTVQMNRDKTGYFYFGFMQEASGSWSNVAGDTYNILFPINEWSYVTIVKADNQIFYYRNRELVATETTTSAKIASGPLSYPLTLGIVYHSNGQSPSGQYNGLLDDIAIYNRSLTQSEINTLYSTEFQKSSSGSSCFLNSATTTAAPTTQAPTNVTTTSAPTTNVSTTEVPTTSAPATTTAAPATTTSVPTTSVTTTSVPATTTSVPATTNLAPTTAVSTTTAATVITTIAPTTAASTNVPTTNADYQIPSPPVPSQTQSSCTIQPLCYVDLSNAEINAPITINQNCGQKIFYYCLTNSNVNITIKTDLETVFLQDFNSQRNKVNVSDFQCIKKELSKSCNSINNLKECSVELLHKIENGVEKITKLIFQSFKPDFELGIDNFIGGAAKKICDSSPNSVSDPSLNDLSDSSSGYSNYLILGVVTATIILFEI